MGVFLFADGEAHRWSTQSYQHSNSDHYRRPRRVQGRRARNGNSLNALLLYQQDPQRQVLHHRAARNADSVRVSLGVTYPNNWSPQAPPGQT